MGPAHSFCWNKINCQNVAKERAMSKITDTVLALAQPVVEAEGCEIWDVEYVKEAGAWYLRVYIDKAGGVSIDDCEGGVPRAGPGAGRGGAPSRRATSSRSRRRAWSGSSSGRGTLKSSWARRSRSGTISPWRARRRTRARSAGYAGRRRHHRDKRRGKDLTKKRRSPRCG